MRKITLAIVATLGLNGCAKPLLDIPEPDESQRALAQTVLNDTELDSPPTTFEWMRGDGLDRILSPIRFSAYEVCERLKLESVRCSGVLTSKVTLYTREHGINAYADKYDDVGVFSGLVKNMGTDVELAAVMAHEFSHVMLGHVDKKVANALAGMTLATGLAGAFAAYTGTNPQSYGESWQRAGALAGSRAYSPEMEIEADRIAVYILKEAGYPPTAMRDAIVRLHRIQLPKRKGSFSPTRVGFLETHPSNDRRIAHILSAIEDAETGVPLRALK